MRRSVLAASEYVTHKESEGTETLADFGKKKTSKDLSLGTFLEQLNDFVCFLS